MRPLSKREDDAPGLGLVDERGDRWRARTGDLALLERTVRVEQIGEGAAGRVDLGLGLGKTRERGRGLVLDG